MQKNNSKNSIPKLPKTKNSKRFHILFTEEEWQRVQEEAQKRGVSVAELIRKSIFSEIQKVNSLERVQALKNLVSLNQSQNYRIQVEE